MSGFLPPDAYKDSTMSPQDPNWIPQHDQFNPQMWNPMCPSFSSPHSQQGNLVGNYIAPQQISQVLPLGEVVIPPYLPPQAQFPNTNIQLANQSNVQKSGVSSQAGMEAMHNGMHFNNNYRCYPNPFLAGTNMAQHSIPYSMQPPLIDNPSFHQQYKAIEFPLLYDFQGPNSDLSSQFNPVQFQRNDVGMVHGPIPSYPNPGSLNHGHIYGPSHGQAFNPNPGQSFNHTQNLTPGQYSNQMQNPNVGQNFNHTQNLNPGQNFNQMLNPNVGQNFNHLQNLNPGQTFSQMQNPNVGQNFNHTQNLNPGQNFNQMQNSNGQNFNHNQNPNSGQIFNNVQNSNPGQIFNNVQNSNPPQNFNSVQNSNPGQNLNYYQELPVHQPNVQQFEHHNMTGQQMHAHATPGLINYQSVNHMSGKPIDHRAGLNLPQQPNKEQHGDLQSHRTALSNGQNTYTSHQQERLNEPIIESAPNCQPSLSQIHIQQPSNGQYCNNAQPRGPALVNRQNPYTLRQLQHVNKLIESPKNVQPPVPQSHLLSSLEISQHNADTNDGGEVPPVPDSRQSNEQVGRNQQHHESQREDFQLYDERTLFLDDTETRVELPQQGAQPSQSMSSDGNETLVEEQQLLRNIEMPNEPLQNIDIESIPECFSVDAPSNDLFALGIANGDAFSSDRSSVGDFSDTSNEAFSPVWSPVTESYDFEPFPSRPSEIEDAEVTIVGCTDATKGSAVPNLMENGMGDDDSNEGINFEDQSAQTSSNDTNTLGESNVNKFSDRRDETPQQIVRGDPTGLAGAIGLTLEEFKAKVYRIRRAEAAREAAQAEATRSALEQSGLNPASQSPNISATISRSNNYNDTPTDVLSVNANTQAMPGSNGYSSVYVSDNSHGVEKYNIGENGNSMVGIPMTSINPCEELKSGGVSNHLGKTAEGNQKGKPVRKVYKKASKASSNVAKHQNLHSQDFTQTAPQHEAFAQTMLQDSFQHLSQGLTYNYSEIPNQISTEMSPQDFRQGLTQGISQDAVQNFAQNYIPDYSQANIQGFQDANHGYSQTPIQGDRASYGTMSQVPTAPYGGQSQQSQAPSGGNFEVLSADNFQTVSGKKAQAPFGRNSHNASYGKKKNSPKAKLSGIGKCYNTVTTERQRKRVQGMILKFLIEHRMTIDRETEDLIREARDAYESGRWDEYENAIINPGNDEDGVEYEIMDFEEN